MLRMILIRLLLSIPLIVVVTGLTFFLMSLLPGNAALSFLGTHATEEQVARLTAEMGLDQPVIVQWWHWMSGVLQGDLGSSVFNKESVAKILNDRAGVTFSLVFGAMIVAIVLGLVIGAISAQRPGLLSSVIDVIAILGYAVPAFWLAVVLIYIFAVELKWFPAVGYVPFGNDPGRWAMSLVLPVLSLAAGMITALAKQTRDAMLDELSAPYITALRANGMSEFAIVYKHALRNAAIPIVTVISVLFIGSLTGAVVAEAIFVLPGLGATAVSATSSRDLPVIQGVALYLTLAVVAVNILTDLAYGWLNPKVRL